MSQLKNNQRKLCKEYLAKLTATQRKEYSSRIIEKLNDLVKDDCVLTYYPFSNEVDISLFNSTKNVAYPVVDENHNMVFYKDNGCYKVNKYGIKEPDTSKSEIADVNDYRYIIVPLVGFDKDCHRLGHGGGYYDRFLNKNTSLIKIGVAYEIQRLEEICVEDNDISLDFIVSEQQIYRR